MDIRHKRKRFAEHSHSIEQLRDMLGSRTWRSFLKKGYLRTYNVTFFAKVGLHLGRPAAAIIAQGQFVAVKHLHKELRYWSSLTPLLTDTNKHRGHSLSYLKGQIHALDYDTPIISKVERNAIKKQGYEPVPAHAGRGHLE